MSASRTGISHRCGHPVWGGTLGSMHCSKDGCYNSIDKCANHSHLNRQEATK